MVTQEVGSVCAGGNGDSHQSATFHLSRWRVPNGVWQIQEIQRQMKRSIYDPCCAHGIAIEFQDPD